MIFESISQNKLDSYIYGNQQSLMKLYLPLIALVILSCSPQPSEEQLLRIPYQSEVTDSERDYFLYLPRNYDQSKETYPVMLFLHGNGERGDGKEELDYVMKHGPLYEAWVQKRDLPFIIITPQLPMFGMDSLADYIRNRTRAGIPVRQEKGVPKRPNASRPSEPMNGTPLDTLLPNGPEGLPWGWDVIEDDLLAMLQNVFNNYKANPKKVYLTGLSYGGFGSWYMASKYPEKFAAVAPVVGWGHPELMPSIAKNQIPVWAFIGGRDPVVEAKYFYEGLNELERLGHKNVRVTTHEDMGHDTWVRVYEGEDIYNWMLKFQK